MFFSAILYIEANWFKYGLGLIVLIPILIVILNEVIHRVEDEDGELKPKILTLRNFIVPLVGLMIALVQVIELDRNNTYMKILETFIWIVSINAVLAVINVLFFSRRSAGDHKKKVPQLFLDIFRIGMVSLGIAIILSSVWGADLGGLVTALGLGSFVIGLALQDTLGNLFSGIALIYEKPFEEGDIIRVEESEGTVIEMNWRSIRLLTKDEDVIVIPHLVIGQGVLTNLSRPTRATTLRHKIGFSLKTPPNKVKAALAEACASTELILADPAPEVKVDSYGENKVIYEIEYKVDQYEKHEQIQNELNTLIWYTLQRYQIDLPLPQYVVNHAHEIPDPLQSRLEKLEQKLNKLPKVLPIDKQKIDQGLLQGSQIEHYGAGEDVIRIGDPTGTLYIIDEGEAELSIVDDQGVQHTISHLNKGDFFGEIALFTSKYSSFRVQATSDLQLISIKSSEVQNLIEINPKLAYYLDEMMDSRRNKIDKIMSD